MDLDPFGVDGIHGVQKEYPSIQEVVLQAKRAVSPPQRIKVKPPARVQRGTVPQGRLKAPPTYNSAEITVTLDPQLSHSENARCGAAQIDPWHQLR